MRRSFSTSTTAIRRTWQELNGCSGPQTGIRSSNMSHWRELKTKLSLFSVARRLTNIFKDHVKGDFRRLLSLHNMVATPVSQDDCAGFVLRGVESSLIDTVRAIFVIVNLKDRFAEVFAAVERNLDEDVLAALLAAQRDVAVRHIPDLLDTAEELPADPTSEEKSPLLAYRRSLAFLEFPELCKFRNDIDLVIGPRVVAPLIGEIKGWHGPSFERLGNLRSSQMGSSRSVSTVLVMRA